MARMQILELPEGAGDERPPFALVIDQADGDSPTLRAWLEGWEHVKEQIGARALLVFEETMELPGNEVPVDPDGYAIKFRVEGDFEKFHEQVQDEVRKAQIRLSGLL
ncbi:hypothetical protein [Streptomyces sp. NPDC056242]|uniref:hypothetical protein n=1 Tax=Streptomyces sp. NPDC056242 TaxID=3345760 RepID=UPI0035D70358